MVKAFNNLSAYTLIHGDPLTEHMKSVAAADDNNAAAEVAELGRAMGLEVRCLHGAVAWCGGSWYKEAYTSCIVT